MGLSNLAAVIFELKDAMTSQSMLRTVLYISSGNSYIVGVLGFGSALSGPLHSRFHHVLGCFHLLSQTTNIVGLR